MWIRRTVLLAGAGLTVLFGVIRPESPTTGSDCELLSSGYLREPVAAISAMAIVIAGWVVAAHRPIAGSSVVIAGWASVAAHATAHPGARALDGAGATLALITVVWSIVRHPPNPARLVTGAGTLAVATSIWVLSRSGGVLCDPAGPWGHATWHLMVAVAVIVVAPRVIPSPVID